MKITYHLFGRLIYLTIFVMNLKTHIMLFQPNPIEAVSYKEDFTSFFVKKIHGQPIEFVNYDDALLYLNGIIKNESDCDDYFMDAYSVELGAQTLHYVHEKKLYNYQFIPSSQGY